MTQPNNPFEKMAGELKQLVEKFKEGVQQMHAEAAEVPDFAGVQRGGKNFLWVSSAEMARRGAGTLSMFSVDAPAQAERLVEIVANSLHAPRRTIEALDSILASGKEKTDRDPRHGNGTLHYGPEVLERFRPYLVSARALAAQAAELVPTTSEPDGPKPSKDQIRHRLKFG